MRRSVVLAIALCGCVGGDDEGEAESAPTVANDTSGSSGVGDQSGVTMPSDPSNPSDPSDSASSSGSTAGDESTGEPPGGVWSPSPGTTWQWQLTETIDTSLDVVAYDIDLFDVGQGVIDGLHADGRIVICYFSAGSFEEWRDDADDFPQSGIGNPLGEWPGEFWIDVRNEGVRDVLAGRLDLAVERNCDAVEPDNVDGYTNDPGFDFGYDDQLDFNGWLATQAHARGLSIGLKNDLDQVAELEPMFDWSLNEECMSFDECDLLQPFIDAGKAVFHTEYVDDPADGPALADQICDDAVSRQFSTLVKEWDLGPWGIACG